MNFDDVRKILKKNGFKEVRINDQGEFKTNLDMDEKSEKELKKLIDEAENFDFNKSDYNKRYDDLMKNIEKHPLGEIASNQAWNNFVIESIEYGIKISKDCIIGRDKESNKWFMFYNKTKTSHIILNKKLSGLLDAIDKDVKVNGKTFDFESEKSLKNLQQFMEEFIVTMILELEKYTTIDQIL